MKVQRYALFGVTSGHPHATDAWADLTCSSTRVFISCSPRRTPTLSLSAHPPLPLLHPPPQRFRHCPSLLSPLLPLSPRCRRLTRLPLLPSSGHKRRTSKMPSLTRLTRSRRRLLANRRRSRASCSRRRLIWATRSGFRTRSRWYASVEGAKPQNRNQTCTPLKSCSVLGEEATAHESRYGRALQFLSRGEYLYHRAQQARPFSRRVWS